MRVIGNAARRMVRPCLLLSLLIAAPLGARVALANSPIGACCLERDGCQDLMELQCEEQGGDFIGADTSCASVDCGLPVKAPLLSIFGLVAVIGALGGVGLFRLLLSRAQA